MRNELGQFVKGEVPDCGNQFEKGYVPHNKGETGWTNDGSFKEKEGGTRAKYGWIARKLTEEELGRPLRYNECVHHIDGNVENNDKSNRKLMTRSKHTGLHMTGRKLSPESIEKIRQSNKETWRRNHT